MESIGKDVSILFVFFFFLQGFSLVNRQGFYSINERKRRRANKGLYVG